MISWCFGLLFFFFSTVVAVASPPEGHDLVAYPSCLRLVFLFLFYAPLWSSLALRIIFGVLFFLIFLSSLSFLSLSHVFSLFQCTGTWVAGVRMSRLLFVFCIGCRISSGGARPRCVSILPQALGTEARRQQYCMRTRVREFEMNLFL